MSAPDKYIGRYRLVDRIGAGGMGSLYLAHDPAIDRMVAIKALREGFDTEELRERFARESRAAGRLRHPNIVTIFDVGDHEGQPFIAMEYVPGETLAQLIRRRPILPLSRKVRLIEEICDGLAYAHRSGIIHRDVKPANLMVDAEGMVKILDFGIVRIADSGITQAGVLVGTVNYMSPEQVTGAGVDHRSDLFAVGAVAYELFAYRQAFPGTLKDGVLHRILHTDPPQLGQVCPGIDPAIPPIIARALDKDPARRYQDLKAMQRDLGRVRERLEDEEIESPTSAGIDPETAVVDARSGRAPTPRPGAREGIEQRRAALIQQHLESALRALDASDYEQAIASADEAVLLDPASARANEILDRAHLGLDLRRAGVWVEEARQHFERGDLDGAWGLVEKALGARLDAPEAETLNRNIQDIRREIERARERALHVRSILDRGQSSLAEGALEIAVRAADEALAIQPGDAAAERLKSEALQAIATRQREEDEAAAACIREARRQFSAGQHAAALALLDRHQPHHDAVAAAIDDLRREAAEHERRVAEQARHAAEARRRDDERRRIEAERKAREQRVAALRVGAEHAASQGRYDEALARVAQARDIQPDSEVLARLQQKITDAKEAAEEAERRRSAAGQRLEALARLVDQRNLEPAERLAQELLALDPENVEAVRHRDEIRRRRAELQALLAKGREALSRARLGDARAALERAREIDPHVADVEALLQRAVQEQVAAEREERLRRETSEKLDAATRALTRRDFDEALARVGEALALRPDAAPAKRLKAEIESAARAATERAATIAQRRQQLAARLAAGDLQKAEALTREILQLDADDPDARSAREEIARRRTELNELMATARAALGREAFDEARRALERGRAADAGSREIGRLFKQLDDAVAARERRERRRRDAMQTLGRAEAALEAGDLAGARKLLDTAAPTLAGSPEIDALRARIQAAAAAAAERKAATPPAPQPDLAAASGGLSAAPSTPPAERPAPRAVLPDYGALVRRAWATRAGRIATAAVGAAVLLIAIANLLPDRVTDPAADYARRVDNLLATHQHAAALPLIEEGLAANADHAGLRERLGRVVETAAGEADAAKSQVLARGRPEEGAMRTASGRHDEALELRRSSDVAQQLESARAFLSAADMYAKVPAAPARTPAVAAVSAEWSRGNRQKALDTLEAELKKTPGEEELLAYLRSPIHEEARDAAAKAAAAARQAGSSTQLSATFREAEGSERRGVKTGATPGGVRSLWEAADLYGRAAKSVPSDAAERAEALLKTDARGAFAILAPLRRRYGSDPAIGRASRAIEAHARAAASSARAAAIKAQAPESSPDLRAGDKLVAQAAAGRNFETTVKAFWEGADAFGRAAADANAESSAIAELDRASGGNVASVIVKYLDPNPHWSRFAHRVAGVRSQAERDAGTARQKAEQARAGNTASFKEGARLEQEGRDATTPGTAVARFSDAAARFREAIREAPPAESGTAGTGTTPGKTVTPDRDPDVVAIEALLQEYAAAYSRMDRDALFRLRPEGRSSIERELALVRSVQVTVTDVRVTLTGPRRAVANCTIHYKYDWDRAGMKPESRTQVAFSLEKRGGSWVIVNK